MITKSASFIIPSNSHIIRANKIRVWRPCWRRDTRWPSVCSDVGGVDTPGTFYYLLGGMFSSSYVVMVTDRLVLTPSHYRLAWLHFKRTRRGDRPCRRASAPKPRDRTRTSGAWSSSSVSRHVLSYILNSSSDSLSN